MSSLTIEQLRSSLLSHSIEVPSKAKKSEYLRLYRKHISPLAAEFSSDEDISLSDLNNSDLSSVQKNIKVHQQEMLNMSSDLSVEDIPSLTDDELFERLTALGVSVGPIVESTRSIYRRKLVTMLGGDVIDSPYTDEVDLDEYSADEEILIDHRETRNSPKKLTPRRVESDPINNSPKLRKRLLDDDFDKNYSSNKSFSADLHTPSPRPSLRTVTSTTTTTTRYTTPGGTVYKRSSEEQSSDANRAYLRLFVKFLLMVIFAVVVSLVYQHYNNNSSPLEGLEELARQALDAYEGKSDKGTEKPKTVKSQPK